MYLIFVLKTICQYPIWRPRMKLLIRQKKSFRRVRSLKNAWIIYTGNLRKSVTSSGPIPRWESRTRRRTRRWTQGPPVEMRWRLPLHWCLTWNLYTSKCVNQLVHLASLHTQFLNFDRVEETEVYLSRSRKTDATPSWCICGNSNAEMNPNGYTCKYDILR